MAKKKAKKKEQKQERLTLLQERFIHEYLIDGNGQKALMRAGYSGAESSAAAEASRMLRNVKVSAALEAAKEELYSSYEITPERVAAEMAAIGFSKITDYQIDDFGHISVKASAPSHAIRAVSSIKRKLYSDEHGNPTGVETEFKLYDKVRSLDMMAKKLGMYAPEKHEHTGKDGQPIETKDNGIVDLARRIAFVLAAGNAQLKKEQNSTEDK